MSKSQIAEYLNISSSEYSKLENGQAADKFGRRLLKLAQLGSCSIDWLLGNEGQPFIKPFRIPVYNWSELQKGKVSIDSLDVVPRKMLTPPLEVLRGDHSDLFAIQVDTGNFLPKYGWGDYLIFRRTKGNMVHKRMIFCMINKRYSIKESEILLDESIVILRDPKGMEPEIYELEVFNDEIKILGIMEHAIIKQ